MSVNFGLVSVIFGPVSGISVGVSVNFASVSGSYGPVSVKFAMDEVTLSAVSVNRLPVSATCARQSVNSRPGRVSLPPFDAKPGGGKTSRKKDFPKAPPLLRPPDRRWQTPKSRPHRRHAETDRPDESFAQKSGFHPCQMNTVAGLAATIPLGLQ